MSTNHSSTPSRLSSGLLSRRALVTSGALLLVALAGVVAWATLKSSVRTEDATALFEVRRGPLVISISEGGTIQNRDLVIVKSEVEGRAVILSLIPEGTTVEKGQLLVELDASNLVDAKDKQQITVMNAEASFIGARENLAIIKSQADSDTSKAQLDFNFAEMDLQKYQEGDYPQALRQAEADITIAKEESERASGQLDWSETLAKEKFITQTDLQADQIAKKRRELELELSQSKLKLLKEYTYRRTIEDLKSNVVQTKAALDRVTRKGNANVVQAEADLKAKESEFNRQTAALEKLGRQIEKCKIYAPVAGMVVYGTTGKPNFRGNAEPLAEGQEIRERQELICLPTTMSMMAQVNVHESSLRKVQKDLPVRVTVDAAPGKVFQGRVGKIALLPDAQSVWMNPDLKVYQTEIYVEGDAKELRAGMTCKAEIIVATYPDALYVPVQSVVRVQGKPTVYLQGPGGPVSRDVEIGLDNNNMVRILSGLAAGEKVMLAPPLGPSAAPIVAEPTPTPVPVPQPQTQSQPQPSSQPAAFDPAKFRSLSREERQKAMESLTPEQRDAVRKLMGGGTGRRGPRGDGAGTGNAPPEGQ